MLLVTQTHHSDFLNWACIFQQCYMMLYLNIYTYTYYMNLNHIYIYTYVYLYIYLYSTYDIHIRTYLNSCSETLPRLLWRRIVNGGISQFLQHLVGILHLAAGGLRCPPGKLQELDEQNTSKTVYHARVIEMVCPCLLRRGLLGDQIN